MTRRAWLNILGIVLLAGTGACSESTKPVDETPPSAATSNDETPALSSEPASLTITPLTFCLVSSRHGGQQGPDCQAIFKVDAEGDLTLHEGGVRKVGRFTSDGRFLAAKGTSPTARRLWADGRISQAGGKPPGEGSKRAVRVRLSDDRTIEFARLKDVTKVRREVDDTWSVEGTPGEIATLTLTDEGKLQVKGKMRAPFRLVGVSTENMRFAAFATVCVMLGGSKTGESRKARSHQEPRPALPVQAQPPKAQPMKAVPR